MRVIQVDGYNFVAGMNWSQLAGENLSAEVAAYASENKSKYGVIRKVQNEDVNQIQLGMLKEKVDKPWSAAGVLAEINPNTIFVDEFEGFFWVCAVSSGLVLPGGDFIGISKSEVNDKITDLLNSIGDMDHITWIMRSDVMESLGLDIDDVVDKGFFDIVSGQSKKYGAHNQILGLKGAPRALILGLIFLAICGGLAYTMMPESMDESPVEENYGDLELSLPGNAKFDIAEIATSTISSSASVEKLLDAAKKEEISWLADDFNASNNRQVLQNFIDTYMSVPPNVAGWRKIGAEFDAASMNNLTVAWSRDYGTGLMLKTAMQNYGYSVSTDISGEKSNSNHKVADVTKRNITDVLGFIKNSKYNRLSFTNDLQLSGIKWAATKSQDTPRPIAIQGIKDQSLANQRQLRSQMIDFTISGSGVNNLLYLSNLVERADTFLVTRIVTEGDNQNWVVYGEFYE